MLRDQRSAVILLSSNYTSHGDNNLSKFFNVTCNHNLKQYSWETQAANNDA